MYKVLFVCHGNICRSPMAEFVFKKMVSDINKEKEFIINSVATSCEEIGNDTHAGTKKILKKYNIPHSKRGSTRLTAEHLESYDYIICMDKNNLANINRMFPNFKDAKLLLEYSNLNRDIADPWYTGDFELTYSDIVKGLNDFLKFLDL